MVTTVPTDEKQMPKEPGAINGGIVQRSPVGQHPIIVINVPSVDEFITKVAKGGGKVVLAKQKVGDFGLYARVTDSEGNVIGLWQDLK